MATMSGRANLDRGSRRVAVITGANRGIGRAIAAAYGRAGYAVVVTARDLGSLTDTLAEVQACGAEVHALPCDVTDELALGVLASGVVERYGGVHTVVANAGVAGPTAPLHELDLAAWRECLAANLDGVFLTFRAFIPILLATRTGSLIAISSMTGKQPLANRTPYAAAKLGVIGLVRTLAVELGPSGIRANTICPGAVSGPRIEQVVRRQAEISGASEEEVLSSFTSASPLRRLVTPVEVAEACVFLSSEAASSITGEDLNVTAGAVMY